MKIVRKVGKIKETFDEKITEEKDQLNAMDLEMHSYIEQQLVMKKDPTLFVGFYNEAMIQLGFIVFFAPTFPLAPLFSFFTNLLEINIKLSAMTESSRRFLAQGA